MKSIDLKKELLRQCWHFVEQREANIKETIASNKQSLENETKSSAGDKHETGRAMLQLEMEKAGKQLASVQHMKTTLSKIKIDKEHSNASLGSIIHTSNGYFFLSISLGSMKVDNEYYFGVSIASPIGKLLLGKTTKDSFQFNNTNYVVLSIC